MILEGNLADITGIERSQLRIDADKIIEVGPGLGRPDRVFGPECLIFAGMGDVHIHAREDVTGKDNYKETFATASAAAIGGGVVHVADMPNNPEPPVDDNSWRRKRALVDAQKLPVGFTLYAGIGPTTHPLSIDVPYKAYMGPSVGELFFRSADELDQALARYRGQAVSFHCEDPVELDRHRIAATHELRRPPQCELLAARFAIAMIEKHNLRGKLCHFSVGEGLSLIRDAKRRGVPVTAEVTPHHLFFDTSMIDSINRPWMQMNPPLRSPADKAAMLEALRDGTIDYLATDHAPHTIEEKQIGISGQPHLDTYGPFVTWLIAKENIPVERIAAVCCANPGVFVNPYSMATSGDKYGRLLPGYTASLTVLNMNQPTTVRREDLKTRCGWSPFEGFSFPGRVEALYIRGALV